MSIFNRGMVSVIIPSYGRSQYLERAINSALNQTYKNIEIIVVNDNEAGSEGYNSFLSVATEFKMHKNIIFFSDGVNKGGGEARNVGIQNSHGEYLTFLDDDDFYCEHKIEKQISYMLDKDLDVCLCNMFFLQGNKYKKVSNCMARGTTVSSFIMHGNAYTPMIMAKKDIIIKVHGFEHTPRFQDHTLMIKLLGAGAKCEILNEQLFTHNNHDGIRITYSDKLSKGYEIRWGMEERYLHLLSNNDLELYYVKKCAIKMKINRGKKNYTAAVSDFMEMCSHIKSYRSLYIGIKSFIRVIIFPNKPV